MFDLLLNAARLVASKDVRDSVSALIAAAAASPDWQKEICTVEARTTGQMRERLHLLEDLVVDKLRSLKYDDEGIAAFRTACRELTANALEHGLIGAKQDRIRVVLDISPTYVATTVFNPRGSPVELTKWIELGAQHLRQTGKTGRGRGLLATCRRADVVTSVDSLGVKALVYRDRVAIATEEYRRETLVALVRGYSNPSAGRRLVERVKNARGLRIIVCLDPAEAKKALAGVSMKKAEHDALGGFDSDLLAQVVEAACGYSAMNDKGKIRIVYRSDDLSDLVPDDLVYRTVEAAIQSMNSA